MAEPPVRLLDFDAPSSGPAPLLDFEGDTNHRYDGWYSAITGIGTSANDKRLSHTFRPPCQSYLDNIEMWRADDVAATAIEKVPEQCFRQGYELEIENEGDYAKFKEELELTLEDLGVDEHVQRGMTVERAVGGAALWLGVDDGREFSAPLDPARVRKLDWLKVLEPIELTPWSVYGNPMKPKYGEPELYQVNDTANLVNAVGVIPQPRGGKSAPTFGPRLIHESRLIIFPGIKVSNYLRTRNPDLSLIWGDSVLVRIVEVLRDFNVAWHAAGIIATDFSQAIISIESLMGIVARNKEGLRARMEALELGRSVARAVLLDTKEKYERQTTNIAGLPDLLEKLSRRLAAAVGMPLSILMGAGEMGIGKDGLSDVRHYYDGIAAVQRRKVAPILRRIIKLVMGTLRERGIPKRWRIKFNPLWQLTDQERTEAHLAQARADEIYMDHLVYSPEEIRNSRARNGYSYDTQIDHTAHSPDMDKAVELYEMALTKGGLGANAAPGDGSQVKVTPHVRSAPTGGAKGGRTVPKNGGGSAGATRGPSRTDDDGTGEVREFMGFSVVVENQKGSYREWTDPNDGSVGKTKMRYAYGYIRGALGTDGDSVDVYLGPSQSAEWVYVVHQMRAPDFQQHDEDKVMLGFDSPNHARDAYLRQYDDERFYGGMSVMSVEDFAKKLTYPGQKITCDEDLSPGDESTPTDPGTTAP